MTGTGTRRVGVVCAVVLVLAALAACDSHHGSGALHPGDGTPASATAQAGPTTGTPTPSASPKAKKKHRASPTPAASARAVPIGNGRCPRFPNPQCTGVPPGTHLTLKHIDEIKQAGTVLQNVHLPSGVTIRAPGVVIRNSEIDGPVTNEYNGHYYPFTIINSTVGPTSGCVIDHAVGQASYTAQGLLIRNTVSGFMDSGDNVVVKDSFVKLCANGPAHSGGIQAWHVGRNLVIDHTTFDQRNVSSATAPIFLHDSTGNQITNVTVTNTLFMGGTYSFQLGNAAGTLVVKNNAIVDRTWSYAPVEAQCADISWAGNTIVEIGSDYQVTRTVGPLKCMT